MNRRERAEPHEALLAARRSLEGLPYVGGIGELLWHEQDKKWAFAIELTIDSADTSLVATTTPWFFVVDPRYPWGEIDIYPARLNGLHKTFPHQNYNGVGDEKSPWRDGNICVRAPGFALGRRNNDPDPRGSRGRLEWYAARAVEWLQRASQGELLRVGDNFELPQCNADRSPVGFSEGAVSFAEWQSSEVVFGTVEFVPIGSGSPLAARRFMNIDGEELHAPTWGRAIRDNTTPLLGVWIRLPQLPVIPPYAAPMRWGELFEIMEQAGLSPARVLQRALRPLRDGTRRVLMVGFPIPRLVGDAPSVMHWQPLRLPSLSHGKKPRRGFSVSNRGYWLGDLASGLAPSKSIEWLSGANWHDSEIGSRGRLAPRLRAATLLLIGAGAIGASIAELVVRGGVNRVVVVDDDSLAAGNLVRHTLTLNDVGRDKAACLAARLNTLSPHADAVGITAHFPRLSDADRRICNECDLILDCSGADDTLQALSETPTHSPVDFVSVAMGRGARRLYIFEAYGTSFPLPAFRAAIAPWLTRDAVEFKDLEFPWEGLGCWHPVFPATCDQVAVFAAAAVRELNRRLESRERDSTLVTLEDLFRTGDATAIRRDRSNA